MPSVIVGNNASETAKNPENLMSEGMKNSKKRNRF